jgi:hypothetical protein
MVRVRNKACDVVMRSSNNKAESQAVVSIELNLKNIPGLTPFNVLYPDEEQSEGERIPRSRGESSDDAGEEAEAPVDAAEE